MTEAWAVMIGAAVGAGSAIVAQLVGIRWQRRQWILDQKKAEYREMLSASAALNWGMQKAGTSLDDPAELLMATHALLSVIANRIFTNDAIIKSEVVQKLQNVTRSIADKTLTGEEIHKLWFGFHLMLRKTAQTDLGLRRSRVTEEPETFHEAAVAEKN